MRHPAFSERLTRETLIEWFRAGRARSRQVFAIPRPETYYSRPIELRNPIVFYEGHLPAFAINTLVKLALGCRGIDDAFEVLFARGIDPDSPDAVRNPGDVWPRREVVQAYGDAADAMIEGVLRNATLECDDIPQLRGGEAAIAILEHEQMHQETLLYMLHNMPYENKLARRPLEEGWRPRRQARAPLAQPRWRRSPEAELISVPRGSATVGATRGNFGWDNEFPAHRVEVEAFEIGRDNITNAEYLEFVEEAGGTPSHFWLRRDGEWFWRGMFELIPLPPRWPVYVTWEQADAYAKWKGMRLPTEAEYDRAAFGTPSGEERTYPWGDEPPDLARGNFGFAHWDPVDAGSYPAGASAWGVRDMVGNGWEWTSTPFAGFTGFEPMASYPNYSADFFDGQHYVLKGASPATAPEMIRQSFRNWFRPNYPYLYATFRLAG